MRIRDPRRDKTRDFRNHGNDRCDNRDAGTCHKADYRRVTHKRNAPERRDAERLRHLIDAEVYGAAEWRGHGPKRNCRRRPPKNQEWRMRKLERRFGPIDTWGSAMRRAFMVA